MKPVFMFILMSLFLAIQMQAKEFRGVIIYNISYPDSKLDAQAQAMMPKTMKVLIRDKWSRTEMSMGMGNTTVIFNGEDKTGVTLLDMMGQKYAIKMDEETIEKESSKIPDINVEFTDETKDIAGYSCKKALLKFTENGKDKVHTVYYTDELGKGFLNYDNPMFRDIPGVMLEYSAEESGMKMVFTAISVEKKNISEKEFETPDGYKTVTQEELQGMFGG